MVTNEREQRYADAIRDRIKALSAPPIFGTGGGLSLGATEWDMARAVMAVADAEQAELRAEIKRLAESLYAADEGRRTGPREAATLRRAKAAEAELNKLRAASRSCMRCRDE